MKKAQRSHLQRAAMAYLNQWFDTDRRHMRAVASAGADDAELARALIEVAKEYRVSRAFGWEGRSDDKSDALARVAAAVRRQNVSVDELSIRVWQLARHIGREFPRKTGDEPTQLSAATKVLWFAGNYDVRIFDDFAFKGLFEKKHYGAFDEGEYARFANAWEQKYELEQEDIAVAVNYLRMNMNGILTWTSAADNPEAAIEAMTQPWFAPRVLDKYLWLVGQMWVPRVRKTKKMFPPGVELCPDAHI